MEVYEKIGQLMAVGFSGQKVSREFIHLVKHYKVGNVILFSQNISGKEQLAGLCRDIQSLVKEQTGHPALIALDQEGGMVSRMPGDMVNMPGAMALAQVKEGAGVYKAGYETGLELKAVGVNFNLAPVLDVNSNRNNPVIGVRSFGDDPDLVGRLGMEFAKGTLDAGILCGGKHFPGHGDTDLDSHLALPVSKKSWEELEEMELIPFRRAIAAGIPAITLSHVSFPAIDGTGLPTSLSYEMVTKRLREKLGFTGLALTDCLEMAGVRKYFGTAGGAVAALKAGADLLFFSHTPSLAMEAAQAIKAALALGQIPMGRLEEGLKRVLGVKERLDASPGDLGQAGTREQAQLAMGLLRESIHLVCRGEGQLHLGKGAAYIRCQQGQSLLPGSPGDGREFEEYMVSRFGGRGYVVSENPGQRERSQVLAKTREASCLVIGTCNGHLHPGQLSLVKEASALGLPVAMVAFRNPYDLDEIGGKVSKIAAYEYSERAFQVVGDMLG